MYPPRIFSMVIFRVCDASCDIDFAMPARCVERSGRREDGNFVGWAVLGLRDDDDDDVQRKDMI
jgi:hypothetical protein